MDSGFPRSAAWIIKKAVNVVVAVLCGLGLLTSQYFVGRGPYPFLALPGFAVLALAAVLSLGCVGKRQAASTKWACVFFSAALALWIAVPLLERVDEWVPGLVVRQVLAAAVVYGLVVFCLTGSRERMVLLGILIAGALAQAALGFFQYLVPDAKPHLGWISALCPDHMAMHEFRARGFYFNANHLAWLLNIAGSFSLAIGVWGGARVWVRVGVLYAGAVFFGLGILTQSRGGLIGMGVAVAVFFSLGCRSLLAGAMGRRGRTAGMLFVSLAAVLGASWLAFSQSDLAQYRFFTAIDEGYRVNVWKTALRLWQTEPIVGAGVGTFTNASRQLRLQTDAVDDICAHNDWVQGLAETGLVGVGLGVCILILHFAAGWGAFGAEAGRRPATAGAASLRGPVQAGALASLSACAAHSFFDFNLQVSANMILLAFVLGLLATPGGGAEAKGFWMYAGKTGLISTAALGAALALMTWHSFHVERAWILADNALREGKPEVALELAREGFSKNPFHARLADSVGRAAFALANANDRVSPERSRFKNEAVEFFQKTTLLEPQDAWNFLNLAQAIDERGSNSVSQPLCYHAISRAQFYSAPYETLGLVFEISHRPAEAIRFYGLACSLPGATYSHERRAALMKISPEKKTSGQ